MTTETATEVYRKNWRTESEGELVMVGVRDGYAAAITVTLHHGAFGISYSMSPEEARELGVAFMDAAQAAERK